MHEGESERTLKRRRPLSNAEMEIVRIVWELQETTVRGVTEALPAQRELDFSTVQTYIARLEEKGYLSSKIVGRSKVIRPAASPADVIRDTVDGFVGRLFGGDSLPLVRHLVESARMTSEDLFELRTLLDEAEKKQNVRKRK